MHERDQQEKAAGHDRRPDQSQRHRTAAPRARGSMSPQAMAALQRTVGNAALARMIEEQQQEQPVQRSAVPSVLRSAGQPLKEPVRAEMEQRLGADFSDVRTHTGDAARRSAAEIGARAYTSGSHVVLGEGGTDRHTLAHELVHVIQQRRGAVAGTDTGHGFQVSDPTDRFEREAETTATRALTQSPAATDPGALSSHHPASSEATEIQRAPDQRPRKRAGTTGAAGPPSKQSRTGEDEQLHEDDADSDSEMEVVELQAPAHVGSAAGAQAGDDHGARAADASVPGTQNQQERESSESETDSLLNEISHNADIQRQLGAITNEQFTESSKLFIHTLRDILEASNKWENIPTEENVMRTKERGTSRPTEKRKGTVVKTLESISIVAKTYLSDAKEEVQTAVDKQGRLLMAANSRGSNHSLQKALEESDLPAFIDNATSKEDIEDRKKKARNLTMEITGVADKYAGLKRAAANGIRVVPSDTNQDLHAEMRILAANNGETPEFIAGTKHPCTACFVQLYPEESGGVRPGHLYLTPQSLQGVPEYVNRLEREEVMALKFARQILRRVPKTYSARAKNGGWVPGGGVTDMEDSDPG